MANQLAKYLEIMFENYVEGFEAACVVSRNAKKFRPGDTAMQRAGDVLYRPQHYHMNIEEGLDLSSKTPTALVQRLVPSVFKEPKNIQIPPVASFDSYKTDISGRLPKGSTESLTVSGQPEHKVEAKDSNGMPVDNRQGTITVSASGLQVGDAFTIAGVNSVHQITKDTTGQPQVFRVLAVSGTTVTISPKILPVENTDVASRPYANVDAKPAESAAITILNKNAAPANLFWADGSVELMYGKLAFPTGQGPQVMTATTEQGATLIMSYAFDHIKGVTTARFTTLYGCSVLVPEYTGIVIAGQ